MLVLHRAERTDTLADSLAEVLAVPLADPMRSEIVSVPARGVERWLQQRLAVRLGTGVDAAGVRQADGIAANIDFDPPDALAAQIADAVLANTSIVAARRDWEINPWRANRLVWPVLRVLDASLDDPRLHIIARHIGMPVQADSDDSHTSAASDAVSSDAATSDAVTDREHRQGRRYATARHIADLFDRYGTARPAMIAAWARHESPGADAGDADGAGSTIAGDLTWQPDFWRAVRAEIGSPHPAEQLDEVCRRLREDPSAGDLPERLCVFGPTRITESFRQIIAAVSVHHDVHLFLPHPSPALWAATAPAVPPADEVGALRRSAWQRPYVAHPLSAGLSRDVTELQVRLAGLAEHDLHHPPLTPPDPATVLGALQAGIHADTPPTLSVAPDSTVEIHACHGPERQIEVLRDRLLHLFSADSTLQPRDVLIMCPDVETFSPLIRGAFAQTGRDHPAYQLRVRLADRGLRQVNPVLDVVASVVELAAGRATTSEVVDLLTRAPVAERFGMDPDDLETVRDWLARGNIRWGLGERERTRFDLRDFTDGTFTAGLDRLALGAVADGADGQWLGAALPLDAVESTALDLVGRLEEFLARLDATVGRMTAGPVTVDAWADILTGVVDEVTLPPPGEDWMTAAAIRTVDRALGDRARAAAHGDTDEPTLLRLSDVRDLMAGLAVGRPTRSNFRTGELTVCSMVPMRSVPHRVIVALGIEADAFPRVQRIDGDDILGVEPLVGERHPRDEDRQTFLDAICAAQENLLVFYSGADPVSGRRIPPAVVVSELADTVAALTGATDAEAVIGHHTLHGFDARNFVDGGVVGVVGPLSHDRELLAGARALQSGAATERTLPAHVRIGAAPTDSDDPVDIDLAALIAFHVAPVESFFRQRLGIWIPDQDRPHPDELDVELDPLDRWGVGDRFLARMFTGATLAECQAAELRRGTLPPFRFGARELDRIAPQVEKIYDATIPLRTRNSTTLRPQTVDAVIPLADGRRIHGTIADVFDDAIVTATYSRVRAKHRLTSWIRLLAVTAGTAAAARPAVTSSVVVGRGSTRDPVAMARVTAPEDAVAILERLVALRDRGLRRPLPSAVDAAAIYTERSRGGERMSIGLLGARKDFDDKFGDHRDRWLRLAFGGSVDAAIGFDNLLTEPIAADPDGWHPPLPGDPGDPLFCGLARAVWEPLLAHEDRS